MIRIRNKCTNCKHSWRDYPGAYSKTNAQCPACGSIYYRWVDYAKAYKNLKLNRLVD